MIEFYFHSSPNPLKVALFLEEAGLPYKTILVDVRKGEQHRPDFLKLNPNAKVPVIVDGDVTVFDSSAILLYLAEKTKQFLSENIPAKRAEMLSWLMFVASGVGPYSGQAIHFRHMAPEPKEYAVNRYTFEAERHFNILNDHLSKQRYMVGDIYTIVDMAVWGWARVVSLTLGEEAWNKLPHLKRHLNEINMRPAAQRAEALKEKFTIKQEMDEEAKKHMFPQNARLATTNP